VVARLVNPGTPYGIDLAPGKDDDEDGDGDEEDDD
jgi:hypothetical protein